MRRYLFLVISLLWTVSFLSCHRHQTVSVPVSANNETLQGDTLRLDNFHHYGQNYNFVVNTDSLALLRQMPEEAVSNLPIDSFFVPKGETLVVADMRVLPNDSVDSVWVQLARFQGDFGWIHEQHLLDNVVPDDPISQFISFFSNEHLLIFLIVFIFIFFAYGMRRLLKMNAHIVHFNDIATFYPTLLTVVVAVAATLYSTIQMFTPDQWQAFYFDPSLNPFSQPLLLALFLTSVWGIIIVAIAAVDDTLRHLSLGESVPYLLGVAGVCAVNYVVFTISTLYYIGYPLLLAYIVFALYRYLYHTRSKYICGHCGKQIKHKGRCPHCGTVNE